MYPLNFYLARVVKVLPNSKIEKKNSKLTNKYFFKYQVLKSENLGVTLSVHKEKYFLKSFLKYCP